MDRKFIVVCQSVVGNSEGFNIDYSWNGEEFSSREEAIKQGFVIRGGDDFNVAVLDDGRLTSFDWMDQVVDAEEDVLSEIADAIGI